MDAVPTSGAPAGPPGRNHQALPRGRVPTLVSLGWSRSPRPFLQALAAAHALVGPGLVEAWLRAGRPGGRTPLGRRMVLEAAEEARQAGSDVWVGPEGVRVFLGPIECDACLAHPDRCWQPAAPPRARQALALLDDLVAAFPGLAGPGPPVAPERLVAWLAPRVAALATGGFV